MSVVDEGGVCMCVCTPLCMCVCLSKCGKSFWINGRVALC